MLEEYNKYIDLITKINSPDKINNSIKCIVGNVGLNKILSTHLTTTSEFFSDIYIGKKIKCFVKNGDNLINVNNENLLQILELANKSHFGKGSETVYDENVRKAKEITKDKLIVSGIDFDEIAESLAHELDIKHQLMFELHKLNIYETESFFDFHVDTLYDKNHIATMLICLDFEYEGGELEVKCDDYAKKTCKLKPFNGCCFFTDCEHRVLPVTSGTRVTLQYNIYTNPKKHSHMKRSKYDESLHFSDLYLNYKEKRIISNPQLFNDLMQYLETNLNAKSIGIVLRHKYHKLTSSENLKGFDKKIWNFLNGTQKFNLNLEVAIIKHHAENDYDYKNKLTCEILGKSNIVADIYITNSTNYVTIKDEQYQGNEHCSGTNVYSNIVIMINAK